MTPPSALPATLSEALARWYPRPLAETQARKRLEETHQRLRSPGGDLERSLLKILQLSALASLDKSWQGVCLELKGQPDAGLQALARLACGQMQLACRMQGAWDDLEAGFAAARPLLDPRADLLLSRRLDLLRHLPLFPRPRCLQPLSSLLREAEVVRLIEQRHPDRGQPASDPRDTVG